MDGTRNRRRSDGARYRPADFSTACRTAAEKRGLQPHRFRYWLTAVPDAQRDEKIVEGCGLYATAAQRAKQGERIISSDELTGVQALERKHPDLPMQPGHVLRREFEYTRHGTLSWFINFDVVTGDIVEPSWGPTRTEEDALAHFQQLIASDPAATKWHIILDNLNIHQSESLVRWIAEREGIAPQTLGVKGKSGILQSMESRAAFLHDPTHHVVIYYTPKHASWMNQVEIWLSILVRKLLKRGNFVSLDDLRDQILAFIAYYNRTMAKPIKWTYTGLA
jgi:transposase